MDSFLRVLTQTILSSSAFLIFSIVFVGYNIIGTYFLNSPGAFDYWEHLASMHAFSTNPLDPPNPYILSDEPSHLFTPYHLFWGVIAKTLNIHVFWLFPFIAGTNAFLFVTGARVFCKSILQDEKYALALILTMLFFWNSPWYWSGFYHFELLPLTAVYPYWLALPISLFLIAGYGESNTDVKNYNRVISHIWYGLAICIVFLSHPLTGSFLILSLGIKTLFTKSNLTSTRVKLLTLLFLSLFLSLFWPYFPVASTILGSNTFTTLGFAGNWELFYENAAQKILPALLGLPFLLYLLFKRKFTYVPITFVVVVGIYLFNYVVLQNSTLARYVIFITFCCQMGIILSLQHLEKHSRYHYVVAGFIFATLILALPQLRSSIEWVGPKRDIATGKPIGTHSNIAIFRQYLALEPYIKNTDVLMAPMKNSWELAGIIGCRVVGVEHSNPFMPDFFERKLVTEKFFNERVATAVRSRILSDYSVSHVLVPKGYEPTVSNFTVYMSLVYKDNEYTLYTLKQ